MSTDTTEELDIDDLPEEIATDWVKFRIANQARLMMDNQKTLNINNRDVQNAKDQHNRYQEAKMAEMLGEHYVPPVESSSKEGEKTSQEDEDMRVLIDSPTNITYNMQQEEKKEEPLQQKQEPVINYQELTAEPIKQKSSWAKTLGAVAVGAGLAGPWGFMLADYLSKPAPQQEVIDTDTVGGATAFQKYKEDDWKQ